MPNRIFIVEPLGGLGNRMRVLSSMLWLKKMIECRIYCYWENNDALNTSFNRLFEPIQEITVLSKPAYYKYYIGQSKAKRVLRLSSSLINFVDGISLCIDDQYIYDHIRKISLSIIDIVKLHKKVYFKTCERFGDGYSEIARFKPVNEISDKISYVSSQFNSHTLGIHIRGTDHKIARSNSPLELFVLKMDEEIGINEKRNFFIATDEEYIEHVLTEKFGERIIVNEKDFNRSSLTGVQDALVDMYCLARTSKIFGSYWSSFNVAAAKLGNVPLIQLRKDGY